MYYLRTKPACNAIQFTVDKSKLKSEDQILAEQLLVCSLQNKDDCQMCGA
jgi:ribonucleoside-diphosphate reductase subunit M1